MLRITRDGEKIIDKKMKFKEDLLSRRKQEKLIFKYLFRLDVYWSRFLIVFLIVGFPASYLYYHLLIDDMDVALRIFLFVLMFLLHFMITGMCTKPVFGEKVYSELSKKVLTRLEQLDSSIIDTTLEERTKIAEWFIEEEKLVGIRKDSNDSYTLFYRNSGNINEEKIYLCIHKVPITTEISNQMIDGYAYSISDLLTHNAPSNEK